MIQGNFSVNGVPFPQWFEGFRQQNKSLFIHALKVANFERVMADMHLWSGRMSLTLEEFVGMFCFMYNETGGQFLAMKEFGNEAYYNQGGYSTKTAGRGLIQLTSRENYVAVLSKLGYNFDSLTSQELDALFLKPEIYYQSVYIYISDASIMGPHWYLLNAKNFTKFGDLIACGYKPFCPYGAIFNNRCNALLNALQKENLNSNRTYTKYALDTIKRPFLKQNRTLTLSVVGGVLCLSLLTYGLIKK